MPVTVVHVANGDGVRGLRRALGEGGYPMPAEEADTGPAPQGEEPSEAVKDEIRPDLSVADVVRQDLEDQTTPSRLEADGRPTPGSFAVELE
jgi:hypothetical protein